LWQHHRQSRQKLDRSARRGAAPSVGDRTIARERDLDQSSGPRCTFGPKLRVIGLGERFGQGQPKLGFARAGLRPGVDAGKRLKRSALTASILCNQPSLNCQLEMLVDTL
jgi:hypothetical protein